MKDTHAGYALMIAAAALIPLGDAVAKLAFINDAVPMAFMGWSRFALGAVLLAPFALRQSVSWREIVNLPVLLRGCAITATVWLILQGAAREPIANVYGAFFIAPILSFVMAVVWLGERPGKRRALLVAVGFVGVLLVVKPAGTISTGLLFALAAGVFYGIFLTANRFLAGKYPPMSMLWGQFIVGGIVLAPFGFDVGPNGLGAGAWLAVFVAASTSVGANLMIVLAYRKLEATRLAPLVYTQLVAATLYGIVFFNTIPDALSLAGLGLLILSGFAALRIRHV